MLIIPDLQGAHLDVVREVITMPWHMQSQSWTNLRWNRFVTISQRRYVRTITNYGDYYFCHNRNLVWLKIPLTLWKFFCGDHNWWFTNFNNVIPFFVVLLVSRTEGSQNLIVIPLQYAFVYIRYTWNSWVLQQQMSRLQGTYK